jgi:hypothetical protein
LLKAILNPFFFVLARVYEVGGSTVLQSREQAFQELQSRAMASSVVREDCKVSSYIEVW